MDTLQPFGFILSCQGRDGVRIRMSSITTSLQVTQPGGFQTMLEGAPGCTGPLRGAGEQTEGARQGPATPHPTLKE